MEGLFLVEPSKQYRHEFALMIEDYEKHGEKEYFEMYKEALDDFDKYVEKLENNSRGIGLPEGWVPRATYWLINIHNKILGVIRIRKVLNSQFLKKYAGHIGYDISPSNRRNGYGELILKLGLKKAKLLNITSALLTCKANNYASAKIIEKNGGVFDSEILDSESSELYRRYWINIVDN